MLNPHLRKVSYDMSRFENDKWKEELRKENLPYIFTEVIIEIKESQDKIVETMNKELTAIKNEAFPNGDLTGHKYYHNIMIERNRELKSLRNAIAEKTISGLAWSGTMFLVYAVIDYLKSKWHQ